MKNATWFLNNIENVRVSLWEQDKRSDKPNLPNQQGNLIIKFLDGSIQKLPMSAWTDTCPMNGRPNVSCQLNKYKLRGEIERRNSYCGQDPIDNPELMETDRSAKTDEVDPKVAAAADRAQRVADLDTPKKAVRKKSA